MTFWHALFDELERPSTLPPGPLHGAYERGVIGMGHAVLGGLLASLTAPEWAVWGAVARLALVAVYWWAKERGDLRRGGTLADGIEDTACVGLGCLYVGPWYIPGAVLALGGWLIWRGYLARNR